MSHEVISVVVIVGLVALWRVISTHKFDPVRTELWDYAYRMSKQGHTYNTVLMYTLRRNGTYRSKALTKRQVEELLEKLKS